MAAEAANPMHGVTTYQRFVAGQSRRLRLRTWIRDGAVSALSCTRSVPESNWIRFPYYHHVFDDQRVGFQEQLRYMRSMGEIISMDDAVSVLAGDRPLDGRYFCISFDDGYKSCVTNALPILAEHQAPATFFVATAYLGAAEGERSPDLMGRIGAYDRSLTEFMTWDDCRQLVSAGMQVGSHSVTHRQLISLSTAEVEHELRESKASIERELSVPCHHFACPKGQPDVHFVAGRDPAVAQRLGYRSFCTTRRGTVHQVPNALLLSRDHLIASWPVRQLRYFFSQ